MKTRNFIQQKLINFKDIFPGLVVCVLIGLISKYLGTFVPTLGGATIAILLGLLLGNTLLTNPKLYKGIRFSESNLLSYSIVLLGGTLSYQVILELGVGGVSFIVLQMFLTIVFLFSCR